MTETEEQLTPAAPPKPTPQDTQETGGRASWEEPHLSFEERVRKYWRQMLVHLWGPAGSIVFHIVAVALLIAFATNQGGSVVTSEEVMIDANAKPQELDKTPEPEKPIEKVETKPDEVQPTDPTQGVSNEPTEQLGGSGTQAEGTGIGSGPSDLPDKGFEISTAVKSRLVMRGLYNSRTAGGRKGALGMFNKGGAGSKATEAAVMAALRWLKREQQDDGSWLGTKNGQPSAVFVARDEAMAPGYWRGMAPPAMTAMALLAYLAHGEKPDSEEFGPTVKKAIEWMLADQEADGHFKGRDGNDYSQPIATYALCEAYGMTQHPAVKDAAIKAVKLVIKGQHASGGFNYKLESVSERNDTSYMAWCCQALKAAKMAGLDKDVPELEMTIKKAIVGMKQNADPNGGFGYTSRGHTGLSGAGALCLQLLGAARAAEVKATVAFLAPTIFSMDPKAGKWEDPQPYGKQASPIYYWYYITQVKFQDSPETFTPWNAQFSPELCHWQQIEKAAIAGPDGKMVDVGHWESPAPKEHNGGVVQDTCLCTLMLEVYYRYLPSFKHVESEPDDVAAAAAPKNEDITIKIR